MASKEQLDIFANMDLPTIKQLETVGAASAAIASAAKEMERIQGFLPTLVQIQQWTKATETAEFTNDVLTSVQKGFLKGLNDIPQLQNFGGIASVEALMQASQRAFASAYNNLQVSGLKDIVNYGYLNPKTKETKAAEETEETEETIKKIRQDVFGINKDILMLVSEKPKNATEIFFNVMIFLISLLTFLQGFMPNKEQQRMANAQENQAKSLERIALANEETTELLILVTKLLENESKSDALINQVDNPSLHEDTPPQNS